MRRMADVSRTHRVGTLETRDVPLLDEGLNLRELGGWSEACGREGRSVHKSAAKTWTVERSLTQEFLSREV